MGFQKLTWCVRCNQDRPYRRASKGKGWECLFCGETVQLRGKYSSAVRTRSKHTERTFMSKKEARREPALLALQNVGQISDLRYQVPFRLELYATGAVDELLAALDEFDRVSGVQGRGSLLHAAAVVRRSRQMVCKYVADFVYRDKAGALVVEDPKGHVTQLYRIKKRLMVLAHDVEIVEPGEGGIQQRARGAGIHGRGTGARLMGGR